MPTAIVLPDQTEVQQTISPIVARAKSLRILKVEDHAAALEDLRAIAGAEKKVKDLFGDAKEQANKAHKAVCDAEKKLLLPLQEARAIVSRKCNDWSSEQQRLAADRERELQERAKKDAEDRQLAAAEEAEKQGDHAAAEAILGEETEVPVVSVQPKVAKVAGVSSRATWSAEVTDKKALVKYVLDHPEWMDLVEPNMTALNKLATSLKKGFNVPGCRAVEKAGYAFRS